MLSALIHDGSGSDTAPNNDEMSDDEADLEVDILQHIPSMLNYVAAVAEETGETGGDMRCCKRNCLALFAQFEPDEYKKASQHPTLDKFCAPLYLGSPLRVPPAC